ncbi:inner-membrane translocator [Oceanobacillus chungangensis]|uniref:Inner-membrane translocator n=1 Tax=Oceanobacillus chungangensis TaxID=1229152 RepID=A0A3D8PFU2_9BACI|nr:inner-membrane translocator [Oceanobacillus chungangensis]RDW14943.1 inner-membrane translocator [Oceanobacillus chungangensis]
MGDSLVWFILLVLIFLFDGTAIYLQKNNKIPLWLSGIVMGIFVPIIFFALVNIFLQLSRVFDPTGTHEGAGFGAAFIALVLLANAIVFFIIGITLKIISFFKSKEV